MEGGNSVSSIASSNVKKYRYLQDAVDSVEATCSNKELDVVIIPPESGNRYIESDEEDVQDDVLDSDVPPSEVPGEVEIHLNNSDTSDSESDEHETPNPSKKSKTQGGNWMKNEKVAFHDPPDNIDRVGENHLGKSEFEIFCLFMTPGMIEEIVKQTLVYARRDKNDHSFDVSTEEMCQFLGLLLVSGYHTLPGENDYWSTCEDLSAPIFGKVMIRDRFRQIERYLHIANNNNLVKSKVAKVIPFYESLNKQFQQFGVFHQNISIDESMVPYHGHHSAKMFIKNKPIRFGFKIWMLCATDGYPYNMEIYCGKLESDGSPLG
ncbi:hypothetical protein ANN_01081 [Periplaneta americana]|uniref:PiggyBac transposable element-derived protein domain-containing protein n=1 Tax=Periplaneta americana TaxID=6978 RepID=A0ABQ8TUC1_PERAM|nr:hypothetical protein ANN_01081 [Periplaneta americana]